MVQIKSYTNTITHTHTVQRQQKEPWPGRVLPAVLSIPERCHTQSPLKVYENATANANRPAVRAYNPFRRTHTRSCKIELFVLRGGGEGAFSTRIDDLWQGFGACEMCVVCVFEQCLDRI